MNTKHPQKKFAFWGTSRFSVIILEDLRTNHNLIPTLIVTTPNKPKGRKHILTPPETKVWGQAHNIEIFQPESLKKNPEEISEKLSGFDFFIVASYGKIIPQAVLNLPARGTLNVHPSLLPKYRGPSPIQSQILKGEKKIGTTIMLMDEEMDHGNILAQKEILLVNPNLGPYEEIEQKLAHESAELLFETLTKWFEGNIQATAQNHSEATFTNIINKEDGEIDLDDDPLINYRKYLAYHQWPKVFFFTEEGGVKKRNIITVAEFVNGQFKILKIIPEGKKETAYHA